MTTKKKLPKDHPQKRQAKRKPRAPKIVNTPDRGVCIDFYGDKWATTHRDFIFIDDPIGSRDDAKSPAQRDRVFNWITNDPANWMPTTPDAPKLPWADRIARGLNAIDAALTFSRILLADRIHALARWVHPSTF
jgi:hypothetical protein